MEIYVVKSGDTLYSIARRFNLPMDEIVYDNQLENPAVLSVGQALILGGNSGTYTVRAGDTLYSLARRLGVSLSRLLEANPEITDPAYITVGQILRIPRNQRQIIVNGYVTGVTNSALSAALPNLTFLSPFSWKTDTRGELTADYRADLSLSAGQRVANLMTVTNLKPEGGFSGSIAHAVFTDVNAKNALFANIFSALERNAFYGVNLDFEYVFQEDRENYNDFVRDLADRLHESGYILVTALAPKLSANQQGLLYTAHDYAVHGAAADYVVLMTYEWGYTYGPPMAVAPLNMVRRVLDYAVDVMPSEKILMGIPNYGYDWTLPYTQGSVARSLSNVRAVTLAGQVKAAIAFDPDAAAPFYNYTDGSGNRHEVWFEDARSIRAKLKLCEEYDLGGVSFWNLNRLWRTSFRMIESLYDVKKVL